MSDEQSRFRDLARYVNAEMTQARRYPEGSRLHEIHWANVDKVWPEYDTLSKRLGSPITDSEAESVE